MNHQLETHRVGNELLQEVRAALTTLAEIERHRERMGNESVQLALDVIADGRRRIDRKELFVCVVGEKKVGKSTFLNAILGRPILSAAVRECTGSVTMIRAHSDVDFCATLEDGRVERFADVFRDRRPQLDRARQRSQTQVQRCQADATQLPTRLGTEKSQHASATSLLATQQGELELASQRYDTHCRDLGVKQTELREFEWQLQEQGKSIPYAFRELPTWRNPIRLLWQWVTKKTKKWARPEWLEHLEKHRRLKSAKSDLDAFQGIVQDLLQRQRSLREQIVATDQRRTSLERQVAQTERSIVQLPDKTTTRTARWERIQAGIGNYEEQRQQAFAESIRQLTDLEKRGSQVRRLEIWIPTTAIPTGLVIIDTPGVNTDNEVNRARAWETIRRDADGCIVLSDIQQTVSQSTREFVREVKGYLPHIMLVLTKVDRAIESAEFDGESVDEQIEEARRVGEQRFAAEVGRTPGEILSFAVSAQRALRNDDEVAARRFAEDTSTMAEILRNERALIVASRCATTIGTVQEQISDAQSAAEMEYAKQIEELESNRIPDPASFCRAQMRTVDSDVDELAEYIVQGGVEMISSAYDQMAQVYCKQIRSCSSGEELKNYLSRVQDSLAGHIQRVNKAIQQDLAAPTSTEIKKLEEPLLRALRERYQIVRNIAGSAGANIASSSLGVRHTLPDISFNLSGLVQDFQNQKMGGIAGGAATGALVGTVIPGLGTLVGGVIGGLAGLFFGPKFDDVRNECEQKFVVVMAQAKHTGMTEFANNQSRIQRELRAALDEALNKAVRHYGSWINDVIKAEQNRIAAERSNLAHLQQLGERMSTHLSKLDGLTEEAQNQSRGLAR